MPEQHATPEHKLKAKQISEETGRPMGTRVISIEGVGPVIDITTMANGKTFGLESSTAATFWASTRPDGGLWRKGPALTVLPDGSMPNHNPARRAAGPCSARAEADFGILI